MKNIILILMIAFVLLVVAYASTGASELMDGTASNVVTLPTSVTVTK